MDLSKYYSLVVISILPIMVFAQVEFSSSYLPIIIIDTDTAEIVDDPRIVAQMGVIYNGEGEVNYLTDDYNDYSGLISIELRGSTSQSFPKKQYGFETQFVSGNARNVSLLGLPSENDWILYAPYSDKSLIRNVLAYGFSRALGHYAPRTKLCEVIINNDYKGVYVLMEKIKRDKNRVNISKLNEDEIDGDDLSGGYILKIDKATGDYGGVWESTQGGIYFQYEYPKFDDIVAEQKTYIKTYIDSFEYSLMHEEYNEYKNFIDVNSFVDFFIVNEISKNIDGYFLSTFLYKDKHGKGGKLSFGPVWDFNLSFGNAEYREGYCTNGFQVELNPSPWWWEKLLQDTLFTNEISKRWIEVRQGCLNDKRVTNITDSLFTILKIPQQRNFERWDILGNYVWPNYFIGNSYDEEVTFLRNWLTDRIAWLDQALLNGYNKIDTNLPKNNLLVYPNPFNEKLKSRFVLNDYGSMSIRIYNLSGMLVRNLVDGKYFNAGYYELNWETSELKKGMYIFEVRLNNTIVSRAKIIK